MAINPTFNIPQAQFLQLPHKFKLFVGGFGSGKTYVGGSDLCRHAWEFPKVNSGYFAPTYAQIRDIFYPTIDEVAAAWGLTTKIHETNKEVGLYSGGRYRNTIICRSMEKPQTIVGFKIGKALIDELDVMAVNKAEMAWRKIIARMRHNAPGLLNGIDVTTTPEGFKFVYQQFIKQVRDNPELRGLYGVVQASTYDNEANLPKGYIESLLASYPAQLVSAYLKGEFVNLASGSVYQNFSRLLNNTTATINPGEVLHVGMDFNVMNMTAVVNVIRNDNPYALQELVGIRDTPTMAKTLQARFPEHTVIIYPDASGQSRKSTNANESDLSILRTAGFTVRNNSTNPSVKDRVNSVNARILNIEGRRKFFINTDRCPRLTEAFEQQAYDQNGDPDKATGHDHLVDAEGYFLAYRWPIIKRTASKARLIGL